MRCSLLLLLLCAGCAQPFKQSDPRDIRGIDPAFNVHVADFESHYGGKLGDISIGFKKQEGFVVGMCKSWGKWRQIEIDPDYWNASNYEDQLSLLLHEIGHCKFNREHDNRYFRDQYNYYVPVSLMNEYTFSPIYWNWGYYWNELFGRLAPDRSKVVNSGRGFYEKVNEEHHSGRSGSCGGHHVDRMWEEDGDGH